MNPSVKTTVSFLVLGLTGLLMQPVVAEDSAAPEETNPVSFYRQVRPVLQRHCSGCHQPAKKGGQLLLTSYADFKKGGENGESFTPGKPDESLILDYISGEKPIACERCELKAIQPCS